MGLFNKKAKASEAAPETNAPEKHGSKAKKNELVKVLDESVWESVHEDFKNNSQFIITDGDGNTRYVALLYDTQQCGGLAGKEARRDESKGSIIEAIKTGSIRTYIRVEMLMDDAFIIIPDLDTIDAMNEFSILADGEYVLCTISEDGTEISTVTDDDDHEVTLTFDQIRSTIQNNLDVHTLFPGGGSAIDAMFGMTPSKKAEEAPGNENMHESPVDDLDDDLGDDIEDLPDDDLDDLPDDDLDEDIDPQPIPAPAPAPVQAAAPAAQPAPQPAPAPAQPEEDVYTDVENLPVEDMGDDGGYDEFEDITEEVVNDYVVRRFYSDDLGLEVSTEPFDVQFMHGNAYVPFNENRGSGLLNEYVSNLSKDANTRMQRMHNENLFRMRERYMRLIQQQCVDIADALDISSEDTQYGRLRQSIETNRNENLAKVNSSVEMKRNQLNEAWNRKLDQVAQEAANGARAQYEERYGRSHESDLQNLVSREKDEIERDYQASLRQLNDDRRAEASKLLDIAINETLSEMADLYIKVLHDEQREQARLQREITKFIDDNRKDEKARIETLAEERRQTKKAEEVRREYATKIKAMSAEFDMKKTVLQADVDRMRQEHEIEISKMESEWTKKLDEERTRADELQQKLDALLDKYASVDETKTLEYKNKMEELQSEKDTWKRHTEDIIDEHKKADSVHFRMSLIVIIAAIIAAIGIGFMFGSIINIRKTSEVERTAVLQQIPVQQTYEDPQSDADVEIK